MAKYQFIIHTRTNQRIEGKVTSLTEEEVENLDSLVTQVIGLQNGYVNTETPTGKVWVPLRAVDHVELKEKK